MEAEFDLKDIKPIMSTLKKLSEDTSIPFDTKWSIMNHFLTKLSQFTELAAVKSRCLEKDLGPLSIEKNNLFTQLNNKQNNKNELKDDIKEMSGNVEYIKTTANKIMTDEQERKDNIRKNYDNAIAEIKSEYNVDEDLLKKLEADNDELRDRGKNVTERVKNLEDGYREKINGLKELCGTQDVELKGKLGSVEGDLKELDMLKQDIKSKEDKMYSCTIKKNFVGKKIVDCKDVLKQTKSSLDNFCHETLQIVGRAKKQVGKVNMHKDAFDEYNIGILEIHTENQEFESMIVKKKTELDEMKAKCKSEMEKFQALKASVVPE